MESCVVEVSIGMGEGQASLMLVLVVVFSSISSSDSSFVGSVMLHVACRVVACFLVLDCVSESNLLHVTVGFMEVVLLHS